MTASRHTTFRDLHAGPDILVVPNPWDVGSARLLEAEGFRALASTSAGLAITLGRRDGDGTVSADETFRHLRAMVEATNVPISADLENGFGDSPDAVARAIARAGEAGVSGASIEDATLRRDEPIYARSLAVERIHAAVEAARKLPHPFVLTARAEGFLRGRPDLDDVLWRLQEFEKLGADVLFAPALPDRRSLEHVCRTVTKPFNYVVGCGPTRFTLAELREIGVRRVSIGASLMRHAMDATRRAARAILDHGTFGYLAELPPLASLNAIMR